MKKLILLILLFPGLAWAGSPYVLGVAGTTASAVACTTTLISQTTANDYWSSGQTANNSASGQHNFVPTSNDTICAVDVYIHGITGDISSINWVVSIYEMDGNDLGGLVSGDSTSTARTISSTGATKFEDLSAAVTTTGSYAIVLKRSDEGADADNYVTLSVNTSDTISGTFGHFSLSLGGTRTTDRAADATMVIYVED